MARLAKQKLKEVVIIIYIKISMVYVPRKSF